MLSYQHIYHAGNLADVHKHALLAWMLDYMARKDKAMSYVETHAGRALYRLDAPEALRTGEAAQGIARVARRFAADHPYSRCLAQVHAYAASVRRDLLAAEAAMPPGLNPGAVTDDHLRAALAAVLPTDAEPSV